MTRIDPFALRAAWLSLPAAGAPPAPVWISIVGTEPVPIVGGSPPSYVATVGHFTRATSIPDFAAECEHVAEELAR
jgi:hypothetical protein